MTRMFAFDPCRYAPQFARDGFVHIPRGVSEEFYELLARQVEERLNGALLEKFAIGDKQQALYEFPEGADYYAELRTTVAAVCGLTPDSLVLSERHIKTYEPGANPDPPAHKDRFATEIAVGLSVHVTPASRLVLYPYDHLDVNPFNSSTELRASLSACRAPENYLKAARRVEIEDSPGDVLMFRGNKVWHLRANPANTTMLYLKLNSYHCDPLGEDPRTADFRRQTEQLLACPDAELAGVVPVLGRRVDYVQRRYNRDWKEVVGVVLYGERHFTLDEQEFRALRRIDGRRTAAAVLAADGAGGGDMPRFGVIRRLAARGVIDLMPGPATTPASGRGAQHLPL
jgi:hypothetical protein